MNRRELIKHVSILTGAAVVGSEFFLSGCKSNDNVSAGFFTEKDISFFDEVAETILPKTNTPGAKDAEVGKFMASYSTDCYSNDELQLLKEGIRDLNKKSSKMNREFFVYGTAAQKQKVLEEADAEAKKYNEEKEHSRKKVMGPHYFTLMKQMVLLGFFTSKPGATQVLRYVPVPGKYEGCIDYKEGETSWA
jgi:hypothetical protein